MAGAAAKLGGVSVTARLYRHATRIHGLTLARFSGLIGLNDRTINKSVNTLVTATETYMDTGSWYAGTRAWEAIRQLSTAVRRVPAAERERSVYELERYRQMLLAHDPDLAKLIEDDIAEYAALLLARGTARASSVPAKSAIVISGWRRAMQQEGGDALKLFRRYLKSVSLEHDAVIRASAYIRDNADGLRAAARAAVKGDASSWRGHVSVVRGLLGEGYALFSPVWRATHLAAMKEARAAAKHLGPDWQAMAVSQLENAIRVGAKEGPDQMILLVNRATRPPQAVTYLSAQVKSAKTSEAVKQTLSDVLVRELKGGLLDLNVGGEHMVFQLVHHHTVQARRYILNTADSRIPAADLEALDRAGIEIGEHLLDISTEQLTQLTIRMINHGLAALARSAG